MDNQSDQLRISALCPASDWFAAHREEDGSVTYRRLHAWAANRVPGRETDEVVGIEFACGHSRPCTGAGSFIGYIHVLDLPDDARVSKPDFARR